MKTLLAYCSTAVAFCAFGTVLFFSSPSVLEANTDPLLTCGDGILDATEECDDGNVIDGDGCSAACQLEPDNGNDGNPEVESLSLSQHTLEARTVSQPAQEGNTLIYESEHAYNAEHDQTHDALEYQVDFAAHTTPVEKIEFTATIRSLDGMYHITATPSHLLFSCSAQGGAGVDVGTTDEPANEVIGGVAVLPEDAPATVTCSVYSDVVEESLIPQDVTIEVVVSQFDPFLGETYGRKTIQLAMKAKTITVPWTSFPGNFDDLRTQSYSVNDMPYTVMANGTLPSSAREAFENAYIPNLTNGGGLGVLGYTNLEQNTHTHL